MAINFDPQGDVPTFRRLRQRSACQEHDTQGKNTRQADEIDPVKLPCHGPYLQATAERNIPASWFYAT